MPSIIIADLWRSTPFVTMIFVAGLQSVPTDVYESARVDGAGDIQAFIHITLPFMKPFIWLAILFRTMDAIRRFDTIYIMTGGGPGNATETLNLHAYFHAFQYLNIGYGAGLAVFMLMIIFTLSLLILRKIQSL
jgi:multiple sugar transport system permease protein